MSAIRIYGDKRLISALNALGPKARRAKRRGLSKAGSALIKHLRGSAPVKTGALRRAVGQRRQRDDTVSVEVRRIRDKKTGKFPAIYAAIVERNSPWFFPAWDAQKRETGSQIIREISKQVTL